MDFLKKKKAVLLSLFFIVVVLGFAAVPKITFAYLESLGSGSYTGPSTNSSRPTNMAGVEIVRKQIIAEGEQKAALVKQDILASNPKLITEANEQAKLILNDYTDKARVNVDFYLRYDDKCNRTDSAHADPAKYPGTVGGPAPGIQSFFNIYTSGQTAAADTLECIRLDADKKIADLAIAADMANISRKYLGNKDLEKYQKQAEGSATEAIKGITKSNQFSSSPIYCLEAIGDIPFFRFDPIGCAAIGSWVLFQVASFILMLVAKAFDFSIDYTLNFKDFLAKANIVTLGWTSIRDMVNLMFIFILVYIGIGTIIGSGTYNAKSLLAKVLIAATLLNFSLFFTEVMIDASNIISLQFYYKITQGAKAKNGGDTNGDISSNIKSSLGLDSIWNIGSSAANGVNTSTEGAVGYSNLSSSQLLIYCLGSTAFVLVTAFVLGTAGFLFIYRAITLVFLMVLSPIAFAGGLLPATKSQASKWWSTLMNNLLFAPIYLALMYVVLSVIFKQSTSGSSFLDVFSASTDAAPIIVNFVVLIGLLCGCIVVATSLSAKGASAASGLGNKWAKAAAGGAGRLALSPATISARSALGGAGHFISNNGYLKSLASGRLGGITGVRALLRGADKASDVKIAGKSANDIRKAKDEKNNRTLELLDRTQPIRRKVGESEDDYKERSKKAEEINKAKGDKFAGISIAGGKTNIEKRTLGIGMTNGRSLKDLQTNRAKTREKDAKAELKTNEAKARAKGAEDKIDKQIKEIEHALNKTNDTTSSKTFGYLNTEVNQAKTDFAAANSELSNLETEYTQAANDPKSSNGKIMAIKTKMDIQWKRKEIAEKKIDQGEKIEEKLKELQIRKDTLVK